MLKMLESGCFVDPRGNEPKVLCETHKAMLRPYHAIPAKVTGFPPGGYQVSDGLIEYGWFKTEEEAKRFADEKNKDRRPRSE